jgi:UDP-2,4-diacetamido-2,4,6-trideoxy-beta-L-altropyranose hydrolase
MRRALFRVDASDSIGTGHVVRCLVLAQALREAGIDCAFACREHPGHLGALIEGQGFALHLLPAGGDWQQDAAATRQVLAALAPTRWLVVDHYGLDRRWEQAVSASVATLLAIDDLADRQHAAQLLLDQNLAADMHDRYAGKLPPGCKAMLGPEFALLQADYAGLHDRARVRSGRVRRVLVHFGGTDPAGLSLLALEALLRVAPTDLQIDLVLPRDAALEQRLRARAEGLGRVRLHGWLPSLAALVAEADLAVGACGVSAWERLCLGLPALVVTIADNQRDSAAELARRGLVRLLGHHDEVDVDRFALALAPLLRDGLDPQWSQACLQVVDARGAARVAAVLAIERDTPLRARAVGRGDEARLLEWANDPDTRRQAFSPQRIDAATHHAWLERRLAEGEACRFYIVETDAGVAIGSVRLQREGEAWEVHFSLSPLFRGHGLGAPLVATAIGQLRADNMHPAEVFGRVKADNAASRRIFESLAFEPGPEPSGEVLTYRRRC